MVFELRVSAMLVCKLECAPLSLLASVYLNAPCESVWMFVVWVIGLMGLEVGFCG